MPTMNLGENRVLSNDGSKEYIDGFESVFEFRLLVENLGEKK